MQKLTPWFDAAVHLPTCDGWYDCKQCNMGHFFKAGLWYRNMKSGKELHMAFHAMHWRGLSTEYLPSYELDDGPLTKKRINALRKDAAKNFPGGRLLFQQKLFQYDPTIPKSQEELDWDNIVPVGREFGSPDFERLMEEDAQKNTS